MDEIRRRLAEIDRQLDRSPAYYYRQAVSTAPLAFCAVGMMTGVAIQDYLPVPVWIWFLLLCFCAATSVTLFVTPCSLLIRGAKTLYILPMAAVLCFACLGAVRLASFNKPSRNDIRNSVGDKPTLATVRGVILTEPHIDSHEWRFSRFKYTDPGSGFYLKVTEAKAVNTWAKATGIVRVRVNEPLLDLRPGNHVQMYCWLSRFKGATNPGEFDIARYMARKGVFVACSVESRQAIEPLKADPAGMFSRAKAGLRKVAIKALLGGPYPKDEEGKLLLALVLGHRANISRDTYIAFRKTGLLHFICLSGMNFGIVIGFVWWLCKMAGLLKPWRAIVCIISAVLFLMVVPENAPALRAAIMCFAFCTAFIFRRRSNPFNSLALAAVVLLLIRPTGIFEAGWQLSFASVLGILLLAKPINALFREKAFDWFGETAEWPLPAQIAAKTASIVGSVFAVSLAAWLASAGILVYHFYSINWLTSVWTVLVSPLIGLISFLGYLKLFVAFILPTAAAILGVIATRLSSLLIWLVKLLAELDISEILTGKVNATAVILFYALILFAFFFRLRNIAIKKVICTAAAAAIIAMLATPWWQRANCNSLVMTTLDVGHGQALLTQLPGGAVILFDAGSLSRNDIGTRVITPFLRYRGISELNAVVLSHADIDHINGLPEVLDDCPAGVIYSDDIFNNNQQNRPTVQFLREELLKLKKAPEIRPAKDKISVTSPAAIKLLWPTGEIYENNQISPNDKSAVTMLAYAGRQILLCSDIEKFAQKEILRLYPDLKAEVLIAPHHGSTKTLERGFINQIGPDIVISSCSKTSYEKGHVIRQDGNFRSYYTGRDGTVTIRINKTGAIETEKFR